MRRNDAHLPTSGMKILCAFGRHAYGDSTRGESYEYANFIPALRALGHEIDHFELWDRSAYTDFVELNRAFLRRIEETRPAVVFCVQLGFELWRETLTLARKGSRAVLLNWATDDSWKYDEFSRWIADEFDVYVTTYRDALEKAKADGHDNFVVSQWGAVSDHLAAPQPARDCRFAVSFVGAAYGNRRRWIDNLRRRGIEVHCFGHGWPEGPVDAKAIPQIIRASVVSLNFGDSGTLIRGGRLVRSRQIKARVFEVTGCGGCLLTEPATDLDQYFRFGEEIETFTDIDELERKIRALLADPSHRDTLAAAGHERTRLHHTYEQRFSELIESHCRRAKETKPNYDTTIDFEAFERVAETHRVSGPLSLLGKVLRRLGVSIWGAQRGPRAARRLLFEVSWRVAGKRTYSARGWPGRLFYRES